MCARVCVYACVYMHYYKARLLSAVWFVITLTSFQAHTCQLCLKVCYLPHSRHTKREGQELVLHRICLQNLYGDWHTLSTLIFAVGSTKASEGGWYFLRKHPHTHTEHSAPAFGDILIFFKVKDVVVQCPIFC